MKGEFLFFHLASVMCKYHPDWIDFRLLGPAYQDAIQTQLYTTSQSLSEVLVIVWMRASHFSSYTEACFILFMFFLLKSLVLLFYVLLVFFASRHVGS